MQKLQRCWQPSWIFTKARVYPGAKCRSGMAGSGRAVAARALCSEAERALLVADLEAALRAAEPFERVVGLCAREARLRDSCGRCRSSIFRQRCSPPFTRFTG